MKTPILPTLSRRSKRKTVFGLFVLIGLFLSSCLSSNYSYYSRLIQLSQSDPLHDSSYFLHVTVHYLDLESSFIIPSKDFTEALRDRTKYLGDRILIDIPKELANHNGWIAVDSSEFKFFQQHYKISDSLIDTFVLKMSTQEILANYFDRDLKLSDTLPLSICYSVVYTLAERKEYIYFAGLQTGLPAGWDVAPCLDFKKLDTSGSISSEYWQEWNALILESLAQYKFPPCECDSISIFYGMDIKNFYYVKNKWKQRIVYRQKI